MTKFTNELGNEISIEVTEQEIEGINGVLIRIEGPSSTSENFITKMEASRLAEELNRLLSGKTS